VEVERMEFLKKHLKKKREEEKEENDNS